MKVSPNEGITVTAKYLEIVYKLELELRQMSIDGRSRLPTEAELCSRYSCSRQTIRMALNTLSDKGLIVKKRGSGSYLSGSISARRSDIIFITEDEDEYINPSFISNLKQLLKNRKYELVCKSTGGSVRTESDILSELLNDPPAAVIIEPVNNVIPNPNISIIEELHSINVPVIYLRCAYPSPAGAPLISEDNKRGAAVLAKHLKENGHKNIAGIFRCDDSRGLERFQGFYEALQDLDLAFDEESVYLFTASERRRIMRGDDDILQRFITNCLKGRSAVICQNDEIAFRLIRTL